MDRENGVIRRRTAALLIAVLAGVAGLALPVPTARAGSYDVWSCTGPRGERLSRPGDAEYGWQPAITGAFALVENRCPDRGLLTIRLGTSGRADYGKRGQWIFFPPPNTAIAGYRLGWWGIVSNGADALIARSDQPDPLYVRRHLASFASQARPETVAQNGLDLRSLTVIAACSFNTSGCSGRTPVAEVYVSQPVVTLRDDAAPTGETSGELTTRRKLIRIVRAILRAEDEGGGVYRLVVNLDGRDAGAVSATAAGASACRDAQPGGDPYQFLAPRPCPRNAASEVELDTRGLPEGQHSLRLYLEDAAGNRALVHGPRPVRVDNVPGVGDRYLGTNPGLAANGMPATERARLRASLVSGRRRGASISHGHGRRARIVGRLRTLDGAPTAGAQLNLLRKRKASVLWTEQPDVKTDARGRFSAPLGRGATETVRIAYYASRSTVVPVVSRTLRRRVRAAIRVRASGRSRRDGRGATVADGGLLVLRGVVRSRPIPRRGVPVALQVLEGRRWVGFGATRTDRRGRFRYRYRLRRLGRPRSYRLRARVRAYSRYPYEPASSNVVRVHVGG